jgi:ABC-type multidrug transport system permease subunit
MSSSRQPSPLAALITVRIKEFLREPSAVFWTFGFPIILTVALGIAFRKQGPSPVSVAVVDGPSAAALVQALQGTQIRAVQLPASEAEARLRRGKVVLAVETSPGGEVTYHFDPTRPEANTARLVVDDRVQRAAGRTDARPSREVRVEAPGERYVDWLVPGLLGMQLLSGSLWGIAFTIVQNRQRKLLKRLVATPMRRSDYLLSFAVSRLLWVLLETAVLLAFAHLAFRVPIRGSFVAILLLAMLGAGSFAGLGLLCAARPQNTESVNGLVNLATLPMFILSGVFFSADRFPELLQKAIRFLPLTALNDALRAIINDGASLLTLPLEIAVLVAWGVVSYALALRLFRWN